MNPHTEDKAPPYTVSEVSALSDLTEKQDGDIKGPCAVHGFPQTPCLDSQCQQPEIQAALRALANVIRDMADQDQCTKCAVENSSAIITGHLREIRAAKKNGKWSKEEKKTLKAEVKGFLKTMKRDIKAIWKEDDKAMV